MCIRHLSDMQGTGMPRILMMHAALFNLPDPGF